MMIKRKTIRELKVKENQIIGTLKKLISAGKDVNASRCQCYELPCM